MKPPANLHELRARAAAGEPFEYSFAWCQSLRCVLRTRPRAAPSPPGLALGMLWGHRARADGALGPGCLSQWWPCRFSIDGHEYTSAEQYMMAAKARLFGDDDALEAILGVDDPAQVKALGRAVRGYDDARWAAFRFDAVVAGSRAKLGQDHALRAYLLATAPRVLVEASPKDRVWGIGLGAKDTRAHDPAAWLGENLLGFALMRARALLAAP
jgi:hypothetical protein